MSGRYYRNRNYNYGRRRYYRTRNYYKSTRSKSWGNMRAAKQQADQSTFTINIPSVATAISNSSLDPLDTNKTLKYGVYPMNMYDMLRKSEFFQSYASMYDEFKIDRIKVKLLPTEFTFIQSSTENRYKNITVYTAWDRTGLNASQLRVIATNLTNTSDYLGNIVERQEGDVIIRENDGDGVYCCVGEDITTYSSAESRSVNPGTNTSIIRWLNPKTMQEKSQWVSTASLKQWYTRYDQDAGYFCGIPTGRKTGNTLLTSDGSVTLNSEIQAPALTTESAEQHITINNVSALNKDNPCYLVEDQGIKFKPTLLVGVYPMEAANKCKFNVETEIVCTFRGLRKASVVSA